MQIEWLRRHCMSLPHATETVQWTDNLVFKVGGKMFAIASLEPANVWLSFKCSSAAIPDLLERDGVIRAPYLARYDWIALQTEDALSAQEIKELIRGSYDLVFANLPKKVLATLALPRRSSSSGPKRRPTAVK